MFILLKQMLVPEYLSHTSENPFTLYGFHYKTMAHFLAVQQAAAKGLPFEHLFAAKVEDLPKLVYVQVGIVDEGIEAMLAQTKHDIRSIPTEYASTHPVLGIGTSKLRLSYGDKKRGRIYIQCSSIFFFPLLYSFWGWGRDCKHLSQYGKSKVVPSLK